MLGSILWTPRCKRPETIIRPIGPAYKAVVNGSVSGAADLLIQSNLAAPEAERALKANSPNYFPPALSPLRRASFEIIIC